MNTKSALVALALFGLSVPSLAGVPLASSDFDYPLGYDGDHLDGWSGLTTNGSPDWSVMAVANPSPDADGNPDLSGSIVMVDPDSNWSYFSAPDKFLGNQSAAFGGALAFDISVFLAGTSFANEAEVVLKGAGLTLVYDATTTLPGPFPNTWTHFDITLASGGWRVNDTFSGALATDAQMLAVLSDLDSLWINGEFYTPISEYIALDNIVLSAPVPEPETWLMLAAGVLLVGTFGRKRA